MSPATGPLGPGDELSSRYLLHGLIGRGGVGQVWRAEDTRLQRQVAIKTLAHDADSELRRFEREARTLAVLTHPSIVTIHDAGQHDGIAYLVMELVDGPSLADELSDGQLEHDRAITIATSIADGLAAAHAAGVIHRDVKPGNILLDRDGTAKLADFGIARLTETTTTVTMVGTAAYLAPEQLQDTDLTPAADIYQLGLVLLEMLSGRRAFDGTGPAAAWARLDRDPDIPDDLPENLRQLLGQMTARDPSDRPAATHVASRLGARQTADDTLPLPDDATTADIDTRHRADQQPHPSTGGPRAIVREAADGARRRLRSTSVPWAAAGLVVLVVLIAAVLATTTSTSPPAPQDATTPPTGQQLPDPLDDALRRLEQEINR